MVGNHKRFPNVTPKPNEKKKKRKEKYIYLVTIYKQESKKLPTGNQGGLFFPFWKRQSLTNRQQRKTLDISRCCLHTRYCGWNAFAASRREGCVCVWWGDYLQYALRLAKAISSKDPKDLTTVSVQTNLAHMWTSSCSSFFKKILTPPPQLSRIVPLQEETKFYHLLYICYCRNRKQRQTQKGNSSETKK